MFVQYLDFLSNSPVNKNICAIVHQRRCKVDEEEQTQAVQENEIPKRIKRKPTAFERRVEARVTRNVAADLEQHPALTETGETPPAEASQLSGPEVVRGESPFAQALHLLRSADLASDPRALRLLADLAELAQVECSVRQPRPAM
jgi:hypothetical protein